MNITQILSLKTIALLISVLFMSAGLSAQEWIELNDPPIHKHHSNGFVYEGKAYIMEGIYDDDGPDNISNEMWEYDIATDSWTELENFPGESRSIAIGDDWNGKYYYGFGRMGGFSGYFNDLWEFDPEDLSFTQLPSCPCEGRSHPALIAHNDKIFMGTGSGPDGNMDDWWEYDISTQVWSQKPGIVDSRHHPYFFSIDDNVYVGGGHASTWWQYNPAAEEWNAIDNLPLGRVAGTQFDYNGKGYVLAGDDAFHDHLATSETFMRYDADTDEWEYLPPLPNGSRWAPSSFVWEDFIYYFGGLNFDDLSDVSMWKFDLSNLDEVVGLDLELTASNNGFVLYPNPAKELLYIQVENENEYKSIEISDASGRKVTTASFMKNIDVSNLNTGTYLLTLTSKDGFTITQKLFVQ
ncbi:MAG: N-acetylneuraminic acid mutarotase [Patiriisocius sp.]|jgi:N-acetylneuraminic acid mutarotase